MLARGTYMPFERCAGHVVAALALVLRIGTIAVFVAQRGHERRTLRKSSGSWSFGSIAVGVLQAWRGPVDLAGASAHVDVGDLDGVVSVAEPVPRRDLGLHVAGRVGRPGAEGVPSDVVRLPVEGPVLPVVRPLGRLDPRRVPVAFAGEADVDPRYGSGSRPGLAAHSVCAATDGRPRSGICDPRTHAHEPDGLVRSVGPLVHVVAGLKLAAVRLGQHGDSLQPLHGRDGVPVRDDESEGGSVVETQWLAVH